ncbi:MAG: aminoglycoside phosphotransferase family protein [Bryobacteraceae bacterium]
MIPARLAAACRETSERAAWLERIPKIVGELEQRWSLAIGTPFDGADVSCAWVAPVTRTDRTCAVLKLGMPHMEGEQEIAGLRFWNGDPTVRLLDADDDLGALLLERCEPGIALRTLPESEQDTVIAGLLRRLWRNPPTPGIFRPLSFMIARWSAASLADAVRWQDAGLVRVGLRLFRELAETTTGVALLATDLHAGNVLQAQREPWLAIDPKPFTGDPAYDATQHLLNCKIRMRSDPERTIERFADLAAVDHHRVRLWMFARAAAEPGGDWTDEWRVNLARTLAP